MTKETLPPKIPSTLDDLERAIILLGALSRAPLTAKTKLELEQLIGFYPHPSQATRWKTALKQRKETMQAPEPPPSPSEG